MPKASKGESGGGSTTTKNYNNNGSFTLNAAYRISEKHRIDLNNIFTTFNKKAKDPLAVKETKSETKSDEKSWKIRRA